MDCCRLAIDIRYAIRTRLHVRCPRLDRAPATAAQGHSVRITVEGVGALSSPPPLTLNGRLRAAETEWLAETSPDFVSFKLFRRYPPKPMRRHNSITGGLAEITFGGGENPEGMSLLMLVSEVPGSGHALLERIKQIADQHDLSIEADVKPLKPTNWNPERRFVSLGRHLVPWYLKRGFEIVDDDRVFPRIRYSKRTHEPVLKDDG